MPSSPRRGATAARSDEKGKQSDKHKSKATAHGRENYMKNTASSSSRNIVRDSWREVPTKKRQGSHENVSKDKKHHPDASVPTNNSVNGANAPTVPVQIPRANVNGETRQPSNQHESVDTVNGIDHSVDNINSNVEDMETLINEGASFPDDAARHVYMRCKHATDTLALKKLNSFSKGDEITKILGGPYEWHRSCPAGPILICCKDLSQVTKLLDIEVFLGVPVAVEVAYNFNTVQGVISDPSICDMPIDLIKEKLKDQSVVNVRPIYTGPETERVRTNYIIISFRLRKLPRRIFFGRERHNITPYRLYAIQCTNCWWFGHKAERCTRSRTCKKCAKTGDRDHNYDSCLLATSEVKCKNCKGNHTPDNKDCPVWFKMSSIAKIRTNYQVSFKRAVTIFNKKFQLNNNHNNNNHNNIHNPARASTSTGRQDGNRAAPYVALSPSASRPASYREATRVPSSGRYDALQDMTDLDNAPESNVISPIIGSSSRATNYQTSTPMKSVRQKSHYVPAADRYSSSEEELGQFLGIRKRVSRQPKTAHARSPNRVPEQTADNSETEPEILSQVLPRYTPKKRAPQLPKPLPQSIPSGSQPIDPKPKPKSLLTEFLKLFTNLDPLMLLQAVFKILFAIPKLLQCTQDKDYEVQFEKLTDLINETLINIINAQDGGNTAPHH